MKEVESLCELLEEQAERQETLVSICLAQLRAGLERNIKYFNEKTSAIDYLIKETARAEFQKKDLVEKICRELGIKDSENQIRDIAERIGEPWKSRILDACNRIKVAVLYVKTWMSEAVPFYRACLETTRNTLKMI